jgi:hypothetical protein
MAEKDFVPMNELEPWIQDVLDAIEYANGPVTSKWGALRAQRGHPASFNLKYVEVGNENGMGYPWGGGTRADYLPRYKAFYDRIKAKYPQIVIVANIHTEPDVPADIVDEHYYETSDWFFQAATLYDSYDRARPKVYVGEYAVKQDAGNGNLRAALAEAAFLTGLERNADVVQMSSYAPLFANPHWQKWQPVAILFDNQRLYATPGYYVQVMFATNRPDVVLPVSQGTPMLFAAAGLGRSDPEGGESQRQAHQCKHRSRWTGRELSAGEVHRASWGRFECREQLRAAEKAGAERECPDRIESGRPSRIPAVLRHRAEVVQEIMTWLSPR